MFLFGAFLELQQAPFVMKRKTGNGTVQFYGYCIDLLDNIQKILKFEYSIYEVPDGQYGNMDEKMNWNGMIKELIDKVIGLILSLSSLPANATPTFGIPAGRVRNKPSDEIVFH